MSTEPPADGKIELAPGVRIPETALSFSFVSSGGPGGQNVNKKATKAELRIPLDALPLHGAARERLIDFSGRRLSDAGELVITADEHRSQGQNRSACLQRLRELLIHATAIPKRRRKTKPSKGSVERRIEGKKRRGDTKKRRGTSGED